MIVGPHAVRTGQIVYVNDSSLTLAPVSDKVPVDLDGKLSPRLPDVQLRFYVDIVDPMFQVQVGLESPPEALVTAYTSLFGADLTALHLPEGEPVRFGHGEGVLVSRDMTNPFGCSAYERTFDGDAVLVDRGDCTFLEKLTMAKRAGASGVVVISDDDMALNPSASPEEIIAAGDISDVSLVALKRSAGEIIISMMDSAEAYGMGQVILMVDPEGQSATTGGHQVPDGAAGHQDWLPVDPMRVLYINGHALLNTRLMV